jgi:1-deoxy-D-xylulose-5-phosphate reductoisomerase
VARAKTLAILGSTGSIGQQAVDVVRRFPDRFSVVALTADRNVDLILRQADELDPQHIALADTRAATKAADRSDVPVHAGPDAIVEAAASADVVLNALVGAAGLQATVAALESGARLALANKESLVVGGQLVMDLARTPDDLIPVDSEHSALFQCMLGERSGEVSRIWLTASGGPFRGGDRRDLATATVDQALAHPRWSMGPKITVDSATLMNKGLEVIEAHHLFGVPFERISVVVHPQSAIHSMIEFSDGSVKAHLGPTDMRIPIQYALSYPDRWDPPVEPVDFRSFEDLTFESPDIDVFRCLALAYEAGRQGGTMPAVLNAANEAAVDAFLDGLVSLAAIDEVVEAAMSEHAAEPVTSLDQIEDVDAWARTRAQELLRDIGPAA